MTLTSCCQILGVAENVSIEEIKRAYRAKAFLLHPDKNSGPDAAADFIALTEAYEYILAERSGKFRKYQSPFTSTQSQKDKDYEDAKRRAREYAQMRYEEFEKTEAAQTFNALNIILNHLMFLFVITLVAALPFVLAYLYEFTGFILGLIFLLAIGRPIFTFIKPYFELQQLWMALMSLVETFFFRIFILSVTNVYLFFKVVMNTLIPIEYSLMGFLVIMLGSYFLLFKKKETRVRVFYSLVILPILINIIFCLNYYGSSKPTIEEYAFWNGHNSARGGRSVKNTMIYLEGGFYEEYSGIRIFNSLDEMRGCGHVIYQFEQGLLGVRVLKEYRFAP